MSSYGDVLAWADARLNNGAQARRLLEDAAGRSITWLLAHADDLAPDDLRPRIEDWVQRIQWGEPEAYVTGVTHFWKLRLRVTPDVLVPRPDTETLVELVLGLGGDQPQRVVDLGTGSGAIALSLAMEKPTWQIVGTDASEGALDVARRNALDCALSGVRWYSGDWYQALDQMRFDGIVSNPPYVAADDPALSDDVLKYEPQGAVIAADDGLADLKTIIGQAPDYLNARGWLAVEHGYQQAEPVRALFEAAGFVDVGCKRDLGDHPRVTFGRLR